MLPTSYYFDPLIVDGACDLLLFFIMSFPFLRALKSSQKILTEKQRFPYTPSPIHAQLPLLSVSSTIIHLLKLMSLHWHIIITCNPQLTPGIPLGAVHSGFGQMYKDMYPTFQYPIECFSVPRILCALPIYSSLPHNPWQSLIIVLPFLECYIVGSTQYVAFSDQLISLSRMH